MCGFLKQQMDRSMCRYVLRAQYAVEFNLYNKRGRNLYINLNRRTNNILYEKKK